MRFEIALELMRKGKAVKIKNTDNYLKIENNSFNVYNEDNEILWHHYLLGTNEILSDDWELYQKTKENNCNFGTAIEHIKKGGKAKREGWNGKEQYISLATDIKCTDKSINFFIYCKHSDIGSQAIIFHGTRGVQIGWLASQSDMLANDWILF